MPKQSSWTAIVGRAAIGPALFLLLLFGSLFGWPFLLAALLHGHDVDDVTTTALALVPFCVIPGVSIALFGRGHDIPPPGDYSLDQLPLWSRYRRVWSLSGRRRLFGLVAATAIVGFVAGSVLRNAPVALVSLDLAVLTTGISIALARSTQLPGRGPRLGR